MTRPVERGLRGANTQLGDEDDRGRAYLGPELPGPTRSNQNGARVLSAGLGGGGKGELGPGGAGTGQGLRGKGLRARSPASGS